MKPADQSVATMEVHMAEKKAWTMAAMTADYLEEPLADPMAPEMVASRAPSTVEKMVVRWV
jgi:hypothetical protein